MSEALKPLVAEFERRVAELKEISDVLLETARQWPGHEGVNWETTSLLNIARLIQDAVHGDRQKLSERAALAKVGTLAGTALRTIVSDMDTQAAMDVEAGVLHGGTAREMFGILRDVVRPFNEQLAEELASPKTEKARVRE